MLKSALKRLRASQPFNACATTAIRGAARLAGRPAPEWAVRHLHRHGDVAAPLPNGAVLRLRSHGDDWVSNQIFWRGWTGEEGETTPLFFELARGAAVVADVGAHVGLYTLLAGHANPGARILAFEPMPDTFGRLEAHARLNGLANVVSTRAAVGATPGEANIYHLDAALQCSTCLDPQLLGEGLALKATTVEVVTLDGMTRRHADGRLDLLKIDTEGTEPDVLRGGRETLERWRPTIICEVLPDRPTGEPLEELLLGSGYRAWLLTADGPVAAGKVRGHPEFRNYLFAARPEVIEFVAAREAKANVV
jgi:FkbM family methyltransferase